MCNIIIESPQEYECCICLIDDKSSYLYTKCCNKIIHNKCLFDIIVHGHFLCPLCRRKLKLKEYFTVKKFLKYTSSLTLYDKYLYTENIKNTLHELTNSLYELRYFPHNNNYSIYYKDFLLIFLFLLIISMLMFYHYYYELPLNKSNKNISILDIYPF